MVSYIDFEFNSVMVGQHTLYYLRYSKFMEDLLMDQNVVCLWSVCLVGPFHIKPE